MNDSSINNSMDSPAFQSKVERLNFDIQLSEFNEDRHLHAREKQYCDANLTTHGIFVIRETEEGWWKESIDFKGDVTKQMEKIKADPTVACAWINQARFNEPGGWYDPS